MVEAYPLQWPHGWPRTKRPKKSRFGHKGEQGYLRAITMSRARDFLLQELGPSRLCAKNVVISSDMPLRRDGLPMAGRREPDDKGVAVYFTFKGKQKCFPCDKWNRVEDNIYAVGKTVEALRGIERWGSRQMVDATFNGFKALPNPENMPWYSILGVSPDASIEAIKKNYRLLAMKHHPDKGGNGDEFDRIKKAYEEGINNQPLEIR